MPILLMCDNPACGELFDAPDALSGSQIRCPACGRTQTVAGKGTVQPEPGPLEPVTLGSPGAPGSEDAPTGETPVLPAGTVQPEPGGEFAIAARGLRSTPRIRNPKSEIQNPKSNASTAKAAGDAPVDGDADETDLLAPAEEQRFSAVSPTPASEPRAHPAGRAGAAAFSREPTASARLGLAGKHVQAPNRDSSPLPPRSPPPAQTDPFILALQGSEESALTGIEEPSRPQYDALEQRTVATAILAVSLLGLVGGLLGGRALFPAQAIIGAYAGAGVGWMLGFAVGMLLVLSVGGIHCPRCGQVCSADSSTCPACGARLSGTRPMTAECLGAGAYAVGNPAGLVVPTALLVLAALAAAGGGVLWRTWPQAMEPWRWAMLSVGIVLGLLVWSYWTSFLVNVVSHTLRGESLAPDAPFLLDAANLVVGVKALLALAAHVLPLLTLPLLALLPLRLVSRGLQRGKSRWGPLRAGGKTSSLALGSSLRLAWRHPADFVVLWLLLLLWGSFGVLSVVAIIVLGRLAATLLPAGVSQSVAFALLAPTLGAAVLGPVAGVLGIILFRCVGIFGRRAMGDFYAPTDDAQDEEAGET